MRKLFLIALKDLKLVFRDRTALVFMLLAPFALTLGLGLATGSFNSNSDSGVLDLPVVVVNDDNASLGNSLVEMVQSDELADLLEPQILTDANAARKMVDDDTTTAVIYIPSGFTNSIIPVEGQSLPSETVQIELYGNPTRPTSVGIIKNVLEQFLTQV
jgi:ABC-2 type transport system permease protein